MAETDDEGRTRSFEGGSSSGTKFRPNVRRTPHCRNSTDASSCRGTMVDRPELQVEECVALHCQDTHMIAHIGALVALGANKLSIVEPTKQAVVFHGRPHYRARRKEEVHRSQSPFHGGKPCVVRSSSEECESGWLRTQDGGCFADIEDQGEVLLSLRMMMRRCFLETSEM